MVLSFGQLTSLTSVSWLLFRWLLYGCVFISVPVNASSLTDKLWLPISYQSHYNRLLDAAEKVTNLEDCHRFLKGGLAEGASTKQHVVFSLRCRNMQRQTFTVMVDAKSLNMTRMEDIWRESDKKAEAFEKQQKLRQRLANRDQYWSVCERTFKEKTQNFNQVEIVTPFPIKPDITEKGGFLYLIEFESLGLKGAPLSYIANAEIDYLHECRISIRPI